MAASPEVLEHYKKYLNDAFDLLTDKIEIDDEGSWAVVTYGDARTTREFFMVPAGTKCWVQLDIGRAMFILFASGKCSVTLAEVPLADVLAPELNIIRRDEAIAVEKKRSGSGREFAWEEYENFVPALLPGARVQPGGCE